MGNSVSTYSPHRCIELVRKPLNADPGIVGVGALAAFAASAILTFGAIILGYFTNSLQDRYLNDLDRQVIEGVSSSRPVTFLVKIWKGFDRITRKILFFKPSRQEDILNADQRRRSLDKFVLTLSDQQLVTGISILVACFGNWSRISLYELEVVVSLAWFSSATHLATLDILQHYFQDNRVVRNWRMIGMIAIVLLLIAGLVITGLLAAGLLPTGVFPSNFLAVPIACLFQLDDADWGVEATAGTSSFTFIGTVLTVAYLLYGYATSLLGTVKISREGSLTPSHLILLLIVKVLTGWSENVTIVVIEDVIIGNGAKIKTRSAHRGKKLLRSKCVGNFRSLRLMFADYLKSFLCRIGTFSFALTYGVVRVVRTRWVGTVAESFNPGPKLPDGGNRVDFGQIVTIVLLILPILAAVEIFHENDNKEAEEVLRQNPESSPAAGGTYGPGGSQEACDTYEGANEQDYEVLAESAHHANSSDAANIPPHQEKASENVTTTTQSSDQYPTLLIGTIFVLHVGTSTAVGYLLNGNVPAAFFLLLIAVMYLFALLVLYIVRMCKLTRRIMSVARNGGPSKNSNNVTELRIINTGADSQDSGGSGVPVSSAIEALHSEDAANDVLRSDVLSVDSLQTIPNDGYRSQAVTNPVVEVHGTPHSRDAENEDEDGDEIYAAPRRQDTESGLRQR